MELQEALSQLAEIHQQVNRSSVFRGYRAVPAAFSGVLAIVAAVCQFFLLPEPTQALTSYLWLWIGAAVLSAAAAGFEMWLRGCWSLYSRETTRHAVEQFLPCLVAGILVTLVLAVCSPETAWLFPGLWQVLFSLGIIASCRLLPRPVFFVGVFYLTAGVLSLSLARGSAALSPWAMGLPFGIGQLLTAAVLYWTLERNDVEQEG